MSILSTVGLKSVQKTSQLQVIRACYAVNNSEAVDSVDSLKQAKSATTF